MVRHLASMTSGFDCTRAANEPLTQEMLAAPDYEGRLQNP
jgi:hypothetical protein